MFEIAFIIVMAMHLAATNLASAGPLFAVVLEYRSARGDDSSFGLAVAMVRSSIAALVVAIVLGGAGVGLSSMLCREPLLAAARAFPAQRYWFGVIELVFYFACLAGYLALAPRKSQNATSRRRLARSFIAVLAVSDLVYHFAPLFAIIGVYSTRPEEWNQPLSFVSAMFDAEVMAVVVHFLLACVAVAGLWLSWLAVRNETSCEAQEFEGRRRCAILGARFALGATLLQLLSGYWLLAASPVDARDRLTGHDAVATTVFVLGLGGAIALIHKLASLAMGDIHRRAVIQAGALLCAVIVLMTAAHQTVRFDKYGSQHAPR
ncbi:MAG TPA: hypothetical protein VHV77_12585 [Pirellulales bacterium]|nr:hypothetical protein [Pirellulales bacterium]